MGSRHGSNGRGGLSRVEVAACPELEVEGAPELEAGVQLAAPVLLEPRARRGRVDPAALAERLRGEDVRRELAERAAQEAVLRGDEAELVHPVADDRWEQVAEGAPEDRLRAAAIDQLAAG